MKIRDRWKSLEYGGAILAAVLLSSAPPALAATNTPATPAAQKRQIIHRLVELTDATQLEAMFSQQFVGRIADAVALIAPNLDAETMSVIRSEASAVIHERIESGEALYSVLYPVYAKHFSLIELARLQRFYQSPVGQKLIRVSPQLLTETLSLGKEWGLSLVPEIIERVQSRLARPPEQGNDDPREKTGRAFDPRPG